MNTFKVLSNTILKRTFALKSPKQQLSHRYLFRSFNSSRTLSREENKKEQQREPPTATSSSESLDKPYNYTLIAIGKSASWLAGGLLTASYLPVETPYALTILTLAYLSSRVAQPLVNTKLAVQRHKVKLSDQELKANPLVKVTTFFKHEIQMFSKNLKEVGLGKNAHAGGNIYGLRGAFAKMLTFAGFDVMYSIISPFLIPLGLPYPVTVAASGFANGLVQGTLIATPEYLSTMQSRYPEKKNSELLKIMWEQTKLTYGLPISITALRNGIFDMTFNTMRVAFGIPFGPSAVFSMTINYPVERYRSLVHQNELSFIKKGEEGKEEKKNEKKSSGQNFQGWFSKATEFFVIYQLLQVFNERTKNRK